MLLNALRSTVFNLLSLNSDLRRLKTKRPQ